MWEYEVRSRFLDPNQNHDNQVSALMDAVKEHPRGIVIPLGTYPRINKRT